MYTHPEPGPPSGPLVFYKTGLNAVNMQTLNHKDWTCLHARRLEWFRLVPRAEMVSACSDMLWRAAPTFSRRKSRFECSVTSENASRDVRTKSTFLAFRTPSRPSRAHRPVSSLLVGPGTTFLKASHTCFSRRDREPARVIGQWRTDANGVFDFFDAPGLPASAGRHRAHR